MEQLSRFAAAMCIFAIINVCGCAGDKRSGATKTGPDQRPWHSDAYLYRNSTHNQRTITYSCANNMVTSIDVPVDHMIAFDADVDGQCVGCDPGDELCECVECELVGLTADSAGWISVGD